MTRFSQDVTTYLNTHDWLKDVLIDVYDPIQQHFPDAQLSLEVKNGLLILFIETQQWPAQATASLLCFDKDWWQDNAYRARGDMYIIPRISRIAQSASKRERLARACQLLSDAHTLLETLQSPPRLLSMSKPADMVDILLHGAYRYLDFAQYNTHQAWQYLETPTAGSWITGETVS